MRAVVQRVSRAAVRIENDASDARREIGPGLLVYLGVGRDDDEADMQYVVDKVASLRIFSDADGKMNRNVSEAGGGVLVVPAFTVQADARRGRRPAFDGAGDPREALPTFAAVCARLEATGLEVRRGEFGAHMHVDAVNDGPICILLDSQRTF